MNLRHVKERSTAEGGRIETTGLRLAREQRPCRFQPSRLRFSSVNAKQLAQPGFQPDPSRCESGHGCHLVRVAQKESERHRAKVEVAGATPAADASFPLCLSSLRESFVCSYSSARVRPGAADFCILHSAFCISRNGDHDVIAASRPVKAFVPVRIRLVTPISMGRSSQVIANTPMGWLLTVREPPDESPVSRV